MTGDEGGKAGEEGGKAGGGTRDGGRRRGMSRLLGGPVLG